MGKNLVEHENRLRKSLLKIRESGLKLNKKKCQFHYCIFGIYFSSDGIRVDPFKINIISVGVMSALIQCIDSFTQR